MSDIIDADLLARQAAAATTRLAGLSTSMQRTVDGAPGGAHRASVRGGGIEFADHREYTPGDDLRHIDWRAFARSDRYTIKQFEQEVHASVTLLVDSSASMHIDGGPRPSKMHAIKLLCATLANWLINKGDAVGLTIAGRRGELPATGGQGQLRKITERLAGLSAQGASGFERLDRGVLRRQQRRGFVLAVSDLLGDPSQLLAPLIQLRRVGPQVLVMCALHPLELDLSFDGTVELVCGETERRDRLDPRVVRSAYAEMMNAHLQQLQQRAMQGGLGFLLVNLGDPPEIIVRDVVRSLSKQPRAASQRGYSA